MKQQRNKRLLEVLFFTVLSASSCTSTSTPPAALVSTDMDPIYLTRHMQQDLVLKCMLVDAGCPTGGCSISIQWHIPPPLQNRAEFEYINNANTSSRLTFRSLGEKDFGVYNFSCIISMTVSAADEEVSTFSIRSGLHTQRVIANPYKRNESGINTVYLPANKPGKIKANIFLGGPPGIVCWKKVGDNRTTCTETPTDELVFDNVSKADAGIYTYRVLPPGDGYPNYPLVTGNITLYVQDIPWFTDEVVFSKEETGKAICIPNTADGQLLDQPFKRSWRVHIQRKDGTENIVAIDSNASHSHFNVSSNGEVLQFHDLNSRIFFTCVVTNEVGNATLKIIPRHRQHLALCTEGEENTDKLLAVLKDILSEYCDNDKECGLNVSNLNLSRVEEAGQGIYEVRGDVLSSSDVVAQLNTTLSSFTSGYTTSGLVLRLADCSMHSPSTARLSVTVVTGGVVAVVVVIAVMVLVCAVLIYRSRCRHRSEHLAPADNPV